MQLHVTYIPSGSLTAVDQPYWSLRSVNCFSRLDISSRHSILLRSQSSSSISKQQTVGMELEEGSDSVVYIISSRCRVQTLPSQNVDNYHFLNSECSTQWFIFMITIPIICIGMFCSSPAEVGVSHLSCPHPQRQRTCQSPPPLSSMPPAHAPPPPSPQLCSPFSPGHGAMAWQQVCVRLLLWERNTDRLFW